MASMKLLLAVTLCLAVSASAQTQPDPTKYTCPAGFIPIVPNFFSAQVVCTVDPCYGACGTGTCTNNVEGFSGVSFATNTCTCKAPAVVSHVIYRDSCYVPGTDVCNPSPCKNGASCTAVKDFNGVLGTYSCACRANYFGVNCDIVGPIPTPTPKGMPPAGAPEPYHTF